MLVRGILNMHMKSKNGISVTKKWLLTPFPRILNIRRVILIGIMKNTTRSLLSTHIPNKGIHLPQQGNLPLTHPPFAQQHRMNQPIIQILILPNTKHTLKQHKINHSFKQHKMNQPIIHIRPLTNSKYLTAKHIFHQQPLISTTTHCPTIMLSTTNPPATKLSLIFNLI
jgi:hypothetical protein